MSNPEILSEHIAWCRKERDAALRQIELFGASALVHHPDAQSEDITDRVLAHGQEVAEMMGRVIEDFEG
jgi:hypothetical protein